MSSHSLKCTLLSWAAKFGLPLDVRRFLGHHTKAEDGSLLIYGRDNAAAPLRALEMLLHAVRTGAFIPDSTRSGRFVARGLRVPIRPVDELVSEVQAAASADGGLRREPEILTEVLAPFTPRLPESKVEAMVALSSDESSSEGEVEIEKTPLQIACELSELTGDERRSLQGTEPEFGEEWFVHSLLGTVHTLDLQSVTGSTFICGRRMYEVHFRLSDDT
jgi:hypothetical protein